MKHLLGTILLSAVSSLSMAQHTIEFEKASFDSEKLNFEIVEWVDLRENKSEIGWAQVGLANKKVPATTLEPIAKILEGIVSPAGESKVAIRLRQVFVSELTKAMSEFAFAQVSAEVFLLEENNYRMIETYYYFSKVSGGDVTKKHGQNLLDAFQGLLEQVDLTSATQYILSPEQWEANEPVLIDYSNSPILSEVPKDGVFRTLSSFLNNDPWRLQLDIKDKKNTTIKYNKGGKFEELDFGFAVANEAEIFVAFEGEFYPLSREGDKFFFVGPPRLDSNKVTVAAFLGGAIGAGIVAAATSERWKYELVLSTGEKVEIEKIEK